MSRVSGLRASAAAASGRRRERGFTLLETIVAFLIASAVTIGIAELYLGALKTFDRSGDRRAAIQAAKSALARIGPDIAARAGALTLMEDGYRIEIRIEPVRLAVSGRFGREGVPLSEVDGLSGDTLLLAASVSAAPLAGGRPVDIASLVLADPEAL